MSDGRGRGRSPARRRRAVVLLLVVVAAAGSFFLLRGDDDGTTAPVPIFTAGVGNGLPGRVTVEREDDRTVEIRPEWASFTRGAPRNGTAVLVDLPGRLAFRFRAWTTPRQPGWAAVPKIRDAQDVEVRSLGTHRVNRVVRPRGWRVTWRDGFAVPRGSRVSVVAAETPVTRPWTTLRPAGDAAEVGSRLGVCDDPIDPEDCGRMPLEPHVRGAP